MDIQKLVSSIFPAETQIPPSAKIDRPVIQTQFLINGQIRHWNGSQNEVLSPIFLQTPEGAKQFVLGSFPMLSQKEAMEALDSACAAYDNGQGQWPTMSVRERIGRMETFARLMKAKRDEVVKLLMWEIGKSLDDSRKEFDRTVGYIIATVEALKELDRASSKFVIESGVMAQIRRAPLGVVLCMGPYNYPLNETFTTLIPALIMGNCVVFKPAKYGVLLLGPLLEAFAEAFPPGVVNTVYGSGEEIITPIMKSGKVDCLAFIGSSRVADILKAQHPRPHRLRSVLGLGAKNAGIILPDADIEQTVTECVIGSLSFNGQRCTALKMLFVHDSIADEFTRKFSNAVENLKFGMPWEPGVNITPLPVPGKPEDLRKWTDEAIAGGAKILNEGGGTVNETYFHPAVVFPVKAGMVLYVKEQFGPVVPIAQYSDIAEPARWVAQSPYGQQVSVFGKDPSQIAKLIDPLVNQVCRVNINSQCQRGPDTFPFAGRKDSAEGTLSVSDALRVFSIRTLVAGKKNEMNTEIFTAIMQDRSSNFLSTDFIL
ncbi:MAG: NADP-dependent glyceraldehyde-3-phosphate dehydrogenase [Nitrospinae bacterium]|nr:NADP-dependent glyceraldehyde-3-phosphate dehydrogenase [Nitrospinota bacterium]